MERFFYQVWRFADGDLLVAEICEDLGRHARWFSLLGSLTGFFLEAAAVQMFVRSLLAGLERTVALPGAEASVVEPYGTRFRAVAVTARTRGIVLAMAVGWLVMTLTVTRTDRFWMLDAAGGLPLLVYVLGLIGAAVWFRQASRITIGRDGILVSGTSRERFFPCRRIGEVRFHGTNLDLFQKKKRLARQAVGGGGYRQPTVSREQLWDLVKGEATDAEARITAAGALAPSLASTERARLRVAAAHCAEPRVRLALQELAGADESNDVAPASARGVLR